MVWTCSTQTCAETGAPTAVDVARSEAGNQISDRSPGAPHMSPLLMAAIVWPVSNTPKNPAPEVRESSIHLLLRITVTC